MLPPDPANKLREAPLKDLVLLLLKQFKRLLTEGQRPMSSAELEAVADAVAVQEALPETAKGIPAALVVLVDESLQMLQERFGFSYAESLATSMDTIGNWETTADFLEIANEKSNAELRISAGASLLVMMGEARYVPTLLAVMEADGGLNDVDAALAQRALLHLTGLDASSPAGREVIQQWYDQQST